MMADMTYTAKLAWLATWCAENGLALQLDGEIGFGRECVGVLDGDGLMASYVDYDLYSGEDYKPIPGQENLSPRDDAPDAYHKHDCLCVLGRGEYAFEQLYAWVRRIVDAGGVIERDVPKSTPDVTAFFFGKATRTRIILPHVNSAKLSTELGGTHG